MTLRTFFKYLDANFKITAPLYNWRHMLNGTVDFEVFKENFLAPTGELAGTIVCVFPCAEKCRVRKIVQAPDGKIRAVCSRRNGDYFFIDIKEIVVYQLDVSALVEAIATVLSSNEFKRPQPFLLPESAIAANDATSKSNNYPIQYVFPFARHYIRKEMDDRTEKWYVDGKLKKIYGPKKKNCLQSKTLNILYDQIGNGWIPHRTFINATGWNEKEYFGKDYYDSGKMQKLLSRLRQKPGVKILFNKERGIKFSEEVVKSHIQSHDHIF
ncbi:MAG: hypothetical protein PHH77_07240 [Victivallaceae bacterium]|nr:hypothetical protein [Victivallaceae bacterium]